MLTVMFDSGQEKPFPIYVLRSFAFCNLVLGGNSCVLLLIFKFEDFFDAIQLYDVVD